MKKRHVVYPLLGKIMVTLLNMDKLFVYAFFKAELSISSKMVCGVRKGENLCVSYYVQIIKLVLEMLGLKVFLPEMYEQLRLMLINHRDLVVATVPHTKQGICKPENWVTIVEWHE